MKGGEDPALAKEEVQIMNKPSVGVEKKLLRAHTVLVLLAFLVSAFLAVGFLALVFDTRP
jgi:hypothetical protein